MTGPFIGLGFLILSVVLFNGSYVLAFSCTFSQCKLVMSEDDGSTKTIDLNSYKKLLTYNDQANNRYYDIQPCDTISANDPDNCIGFKGCQRASATSSHPMGMKDNPGCTYLTGSDPYVTFAGAEDGGYKRSVQVTYKCDETSAGLSLVLTGVVPVASDETAYQFILRDSWTSSEICPFTICIAPSQLISLPIVIPSPWQEEEVTVESRKKTLMAGVRLILFHQQNLREWFVQCVAAATLRALCHTPKACQIRMREDDGSINVINLLKYFQTTFHYYDSEEGYYYDLELCGSLDNSTEVEAECLEAKACQTSSRGSRPLGDPEDHTCWYDSGVDPYLTFAAIDAGTSYQRMVRITYDCDSSEEGLKMEFNGVVPVARYMSTYMFTLTGADACPVAGICEGKNGRLKCAFAFLLILLSLVLLVYFISGIVARMIFIYQSCKSKNEDNGYFNSEGQETKGQCFKKDLL